MDKRTEEIAVGGTKCFEYQVVAFPPPTVTWFKDDTNITHDPRYKIRYHRKLGTMSMVIKHITPDDEGCYKCRAKNDEGVAISMAYLTVKSPSRGQYARARADSTSSSSSSDSDTMTLDQWSTTVTKMYKKKKDAMYTAPKITYENMLAEELHLRVGTTLHIEVNVAGHPNPKVTWLHGDDLFRESNKQFTETDEGFSFLKIKGIKRRHAGIYKVLAENRAGKAQAEFCVVVKSPPSAPLNLKVTQVYSDFVELSWEPPDDDGGERILGYRIEKSSAGEGYVPSGRISAFHSHYRVTKLIERRKYMFRISAENMIGVGLPAETPEPILTRLPYDPPGIPENLQAMDTASDQITIAWAPPLEDGGSPITQYVVEKKDTSRMTSMWVSSTVDAHTNMLIARNLLQDNWYLFRVFAENRAGMGEPAALRDPVQAKLPFNKPGPPQSLEVYETWSDWITIRWDPPLTDGGTPLTGYIIEKRDAKRKEYIYQAEIKPATLPMYTADRLFEGAEYYFRVKAVNMVGVSEPTEMENPVKAKLPYSEPDPPRKLRIIEYWIDYISLRWEEPYDDGGSPIINYLIEKRDATRANWNKAAVVSAETFTYKATKLFENESYYFRVSAVNKAGNSRPCELDTAQICKMPYDPPQQPVNLRITAYDVNYMTATWEKPGHDGGSSITHYMVEYRDELSSIWLTGEQVDSSVYEFKFSGLTKGQSYVVRVAAVNSVGRGPFSVLPEPQMAKVPFNKPGPPTDFHVTEIWSDYMSVMWEEPDYDGGSPITGYTVEVKEAFDISFRHVADLAVHVRSHKVTGLREGKEYWFRVFAQNAAGLSDPPAKTDKPVIAKLPFDPPGPPRRLQVTGTDEGRISIQWEPPTSDGGSPVTQYIIETCSTADTRYLKMGEVNASVLTHDLKDLRNRGEYFIRVYAVNLAGKSKAFVETESAISASPPMQRPEPPRNVKCVTSTNDSITIAWQPAEFDLKCAPSGYVIESRMADETRFRHAGTVQEWIHQYRLTGLIKGVAYVLRVFAENAAGLSDPAMLPKPITAKMFYDIPSDPENFQVYNIKPFSASLSWSKPVSDGGNPIRGYMLQMRSTKETKFRIISRVNAKTEKFKAKGLREGKEYVFRAKAINEAGESEPGAECTFTTKVQMAPPLSPKRLKVTEVTESTVTLTWKAPEPVSVPRGLLGPGPVEHYVVDMKRVEDENYLEVTRVTSDTLTHIVTDLKEGWAYNMRVRSVNDAGWCKKPAVLEHAVTPIAPKGAPSAPMNLMASQIGHDFIRIQWLPPISDGGSPIRRFIIVMKEAADKKFKRVNTVDGGVCAFEITKGVRERKEYEIRVYAENDIGVSEEWAELQTPVQTSAKPRRREELMTAIDVVDLSMLSKIEEVTAKELMVPLAPTHLRVADLTSETMTLTWDIPEDDGGSPVTSYTVVLREGTQRKFREVGKISDLSIIIPVKGSVRYMFRVYAENAVGLSEDYAADGVQAPVQEKDYMEEASKRAAAAAPIKRVGPSLPSAPWDLKIAALTFERVTLQWDLPLDDGGSPVFSYTVAMRESDKQRFREVCKVEDLAVALNVTPNMEYFFRVYSENKVGVSEEFAGTKQAVRVLARPRSTPSRDIKVQVKKIPKRKLEPSVEKEAAPKKSVPSAPTHLEVTDVTHEHATLIWDDPEKDGGSPVTKYKIVMRESHLRNFTELAEVEKKTFTASVEAGSMYMFRVYAINVIGISKEYAETPGPIDIPERKFELQPKPSAQLPAFVEKPKAGSFKEEDTITLTCKVSGDPQPDVYWMKNNKEIRPSRINKRLKMFWCVATDIYYLEIEKAEEEDEGTYTAVAFNLNDDEEKCDVAWDFLGEKKAKEKTTTKRKAKKKKVPTATLR